MKNISLFTNPISFYSGSLSNHGTSQSDLMDKAKHNERPTDIVLMGTLREEASAQALGANRMRTLLLNFIT